MHTKFWLALMILLGLGLRLSMLIQFSNGVFFEADSFYYFGVANLTLHNNLIIPSPLPLVGFPEHVQYGESPGLIYLIILGYFFIPYYFVSQGQMILISMYAIPVVFGLLGVLISYLIAKRLFKKELIGLIAAFFAATLPVAIYRTMALAYRGESIIPVLFACFIYWQASEDKRVRYLSWLIIPISIFIWKASLYLIAIIVIFYILRWTWTNKQREYPLIFIGIFIMGLCISPIFLQYGLDTAYGILHTTLEGLPITPSALVLFFNYTLVLLPLGALLSFKAKPDRQESILQTYLMASMMVIVPLMIWMVRWIFLLPIVASILAAYGLYRIFVFLQDRGIKAGYIALCVVLLFTLIASAPVILNAQPINNMPQLIQALSWIDNNTQSNATFLTFWADGSQIVWANRISYEVSVNQNATRDQAFGQFMMARNGNFTYLKELNPDYLIIRKYWKGTSSAIAEEGNVPDIYNGSNLQAFIDGNVPYRDVFSNNDTLVYAIK